MAEQVIPMDTEGTRKKPVGLLEAVSEIQLYYVAESGGSELPGHYVTLERQMEYFVIGFKSVLHGGLFTILFMPLLIGVLEDKIHIFGHVHRTMLDNVYMFAMTLLFSLSYAFFYVYSSSFNAGAVTRKMILNLYSGVTFGSILKAIVSIIVYHIFYFYVVTDRNVFVVLQNLRFIRAHVRNDIFYWIHDTKDVLISSSMWVFFTSLCTVIMCWIAYFVSENRKKSKEKEYGWK